MTIKDIKYLFILLAGCLFCCTETSEGCLDRTARNFDVTADDDCCLDVPTDECCCTFPDLELGVSYKLRAADTLSDLATNFDLETFYAREEFQDSIRIDSFFLFVNQVKPMNLALADSICVLERIEFTQLDGGGQTLSLSVEDNVTLIDGFQFSFELGTYQSDLDFDQIDLSLGLPNEIAQIDPNNIINTNNLGDSFDFLFDEDTGSFPSMRINLTLKQGDDQRVIARELRFDERLSFALTALILNELGADLTILLRINMLDVFKGIIFDVEDEDIDLIIRENLVSSVFLIE